ncbi:MAG: DUF2752 domain-containing protein [Defluviitaleaceae bacterium]|nr:DUF2752 domain-containing protein [Defluviitaleaceae bacterium]
MPKITKIIQRNAKNLRNYCIIAAILVAYYIATNYFFGYVSPTMILFGLPCPACGFMRSALLFLGGNFSESFAMHPLFMPVLAFAVFAALYTFVGDRQNRQKKINRLKYGVILLLLTAIVLYVYRMATIFPHQEPLLLNTNSVLHGILAGLGE